MKQSTGSTSNMRWRNYLLTGIYIAVALLLGFVGLSFLFSDLGPEETGIERAAVTAAYYFITAFLLGAASPSRWRLAVIVSWAALLLGVTGLLGNLGRGFEPLRQVLLMLLPVPISLLAAYLGALLRRRLSR